MDTRKLFCLILMTIVFVAKSRLLSSSPRLIVQQGENTIQAFDVVKLVSVTLVQNFEWSPIANFDLYHNKTVYYSLLSFDDPIYSSSKEYKNLKQLPFIWDISSVAVDYRSEKVYAYDKISRKLILFDMQGKYYNVLLSDLDTMEEIILNPDYGLMYLLSPTQILMGDMDGSDIREFAKGSNMSAMAIATGSDSDPERIYWSENRSLIRSHDLTSSYPRNVTEAFGTVFSLAVLKNDLYYTSQNPAGSYNLYWCLLNDDGICDGIHEKIPFDNPRMLKAYNPNKRFLKQNPCEYYNAGCEHLCVLAGESPVGYSISCACNIGWKLQQDERSCSHIDEFGLYARNDHLRGRVLEPIGNSFVEAFMPISLSFLNLVHKKTIEFDFNVYKGYIVMADDLGLRYLKINGMCIRGCPSQPSDMEKEYDMYPAVDWINNNIYYLSTSREVGPSYLMLRKSPENFNHSSSSARVIHQFASHEQPRALVVQPNEQSRLFISLYDTKNKQANIYTIYPIDDQGLIPFLNLSRGYEQLSINETCLSIDQIDSRLYWFSEAKTEVQYISIHNLDEGLKTFSISSIQNPLSINIYGDRMYISNMTDVYCVDKITGQFVKKLLPTYKEGMQSVFKVYGKSSQPINSKSPCTINNGGCSRYCFFIKRENIKICACNDDEQLMKNKKTCKKYF